MVNGENASGTGLTPRQADRMLDAGADVITLGNHSFDRREICTYLDDCPYILRPGNLRPSLPGHGWGVFETKIGPVGVMNLLGRCNLDFRPDNPFLIADKILQELGEVPVFWTSTPRQRAKSSPWPISWTGRSLPSGARTRMYRPPTSRSCRTARAI